mgnify:CR=1 FL=1
MQAQAALLGSDFSEQTSNVFTEFYFLSGDIEVCVELLCIEAML